MSRRRTTAHDQKPSGARHSDPGSKHVASDALTSQRRQSAPATVCTHPKRVKEFFLASLLVRVPGQRGRHAWRREVLRADTPRALHWLIDGRTHVAYASNGVEAIRIELIDTGRTLLAPVADGADVEGLADLLARVDVHPLSTVW
jgi:hypothetical protein